MTFSILRREDLKKILWRSNFLEYQLTRKSILWISESWFFFIPFYILFLILEIYFDIAQHFRALSTIDILRIKKAFRINCGSDRGLMDTETDTSLYNQTKPFEELSRPRFVAFHSWRNNSCIKMDFGWHGEKKMIFNLIVVTLLFHKVNKKDFFLSFYRWSHIKNDWSAISFKVITGHLS